MGQSPDSISAPVVRAPGTALQVATDSYGGDSIGSSSMHSPLAIPGATAPRGDTIKSAAIEPRRSALKRLPHVAVLSFTGEGIAAKDLNAVTNRFESELLASDSFKVVERRNIDKILKEQGLQMSGACDNSECSVEIGQILSVDGIYTGELAQTGKIWSLSIKRTEVGTSQTTFSHVLDIQGSLEDVLRGGCPEMARFASGRKKPENNRTVLVAKKASVWPWVIGGTAAAGGVAAAILLLTKEESTPDVPTTIRTVDLTFDTGK